MSLPAEFTSGALFGLALLLSGVYAPEVITAQMLFTRMQMLQVFLGGSATSAIVYHLADKSGLLSKKHRPPSSLGLFRFDGNILGGALIGLGMAVTGACPGTAMVQLGVGMVNGALVIVGGTLGAAVFLKARPVLQGDAAATSAAVEPETTNTAPATTSKALDIPTALSISPLTMLLLWTPMCAAVIGAARLIDSSSLQSRGVGMVTPAFGGLLIGLAQAGTVLLTRHHIGASAGYEDVARWITYKCSPQRASAVVSPSLTTPAIAFTTGMVCSAALLKNLVLGPGDMVSETSAIDLPYVLRTVGGGASMVFGARLAGGCTSGHGISGLSKFSLASLATTVAIFAGGIVSAQLLRT